MSIKGLSLLRNNFVSHITEIYGSKLSKLFRENYFRNKRQKWMVEEFKKVTLMEEGLDS